MRRPATSYTDLAADVTARLVAQIETGPGVWHMPWHTVDGFLDVHNAAASNGVRRCVGSRAT